MSSPIIDAFAAALERLDLLLHREILRLRACYQLSLDEFRGLYVSDEQVDRLVTETGPSADGEGSIAELSRKAEALAGQPMNGALAALVQMFSLTPFEADVLLLALAPEVDVKYETLFAYLNNDVTRKQPTVDLALRLFARTTADRGHLQRWSRLFTGSLLEPIEAAADRRSGLSLAFALAPALSAALQGLPAFDLRLAGWAERPGERSPGATGPLPPGIGAELERLRGRLAASAETAVVVLEGEPGLGQDAIAATLFADRGHEELRLGPPPTSEPAPIATLALVARLRGAGVSLDLEEWSSEAGRRMLPSLLGALYRVGVPIVALASGRSAWRPLVRGLPAVSLVLQAPDASEREVLWQSALGRAGVTAPRELVSELADHFKLGPAQIARAARGLPASEQAMGRESLFQAAREQSASDLRQLASEVPTRHGWDDLVLPAVLQRRLRDVTGAIRARGTVFGSWGFGASGGRGLMVLFSGASGTGKTMSASVIAREIGLELYRIDLAGVISKYIGETEKNLHRVFEAARAANVILFFDEADALMGKRSEVKDAHDRYANIEVAYLLQKMEDHDGVVILASNLSKNMDQAFARRMHYVLEFPRPDAPLRERLWRQMFPPRTPIAADVDFAFLARQFNLTGGDIRTVALDAAFAAAGESRAIAMADLLAATTRQMSKQGKPLGASDLKQYHQHSGGHRGASDGPAARPAGVLPVAPVHSTTDVIG